MSQQLINRSPDLLRLQNDGYDIEIRAAYLVVRDVPYVNSRRDVRRGMLVSELTLSGDVTSTPSTHVIYFAGEHPCGVDGTKLVRIEHQSAETRLDTDLVVQHSFSAKPMNGYADYYHKITTYVALISGPAQAIDPNVTSKTFPVIENEAGQSVFCYLDTASSRAEINVVSKKLELNRIAIVGVGGTGSYVLDLVAKTPVREIHLFEGDRFSQHNAFRSPGAAPIRALRSKPKKAAYFTKLYSRMHRGIVDHKDFINDENLEELADMDFVFLCMDKGGMKQKIVRFLQENDKPFVDVGMGVLLVDESLGGNLRITSSTMDRQDHIWERGRIPFGDGDHNADYDRNIQIADLNALNAALAVIKWKKIFGFYRDFGREHYTAYAIDTNTLINEDEA